MISKADYRFRFRFGLWFGFDHWFVFNYGLWLRLRLRLWFGRGFFDNPLLLLLFHFFDFFGRFGFSLRLWLNFRWNVFRLSCGNRLSINWRPIKPFDRLFRGGVLIIFASFALFLVFKSDAFRYALLINLRKCSIIKADCQER